MGTIVHQGSALGVVVRTGAGTAFGQIAAGLSEKQGQTAFEAGLSRFSRFLFGVAAILTAFIFIANVLLARPLIEALLFSLAIAVGIAPEMMPAIVTVSLSAGSRSPGGEKGPGEAARCHRGPGQYRDPLHRQDGHPHRRGHHLRAGAGRRRGAPAIARCCSGSCATKRPSPTGGPSGGTHWTRPCGRPPKRRPGKGVAASAAAYQRLGVLPFDHERQLASVLVEGLLWEAAPDHQRCPRGGA